jgi:hypothetical protein
MPAKKQNKREPSKSLKNRDRGGFSKPKPAKSPRVIGKTLPPANLRNEWSLKRTRGRGALLINQEGYEAANFESYAVAEQVLAALELTTVDQRLKYLMGRK